MKYDFYKFKQENVQYYSIILGYLDDISAHFNSCQDFIMFLQKILKQLNEQNK